MQHRRLEKDIAWSEEFRFLLRDFDGSSRIWRKQDEHMVISYLLSVVQTAVGGEMVCETNGKIFICINCDPSNQYKII